MNNGLRRRSHIRQKHLETCDPTHQSLSNTKKKHRTNSQGENGAMLRKKALAHSTVEPKNAVGRSEQEEMLITIHAGYIC